MTDRERALKSKSFCAALWTSIFQNPDGMVAPCCVWDSDTEQHGLGNVNKSTLAEIYKSPTVLKLKEKMLSGERLNECNFCNKLETDIPGSDGSKSFFNDNFFESIDWDSSDTKFLYWDLRISNLCNFKCRMCFHDLSSAWYDDAILIADKIENRNKPNERIIKINDKSKFWNELETHYEHVQSIYFAGGEPFINEHHFKILQDLIDRQLNSNIKLIVNTNLSTTEFKKEKVLNYYKHFNHVVFGFSIDGSYKIGEYIRKGLDYSQWKLNVREFVNFINERNTMNITYVFQFAYGVTNLDNICDFILDLVNDGLLLDAQCKFNFQPIMNPIEQSVVSLPPEIFTKFKKDYTNLKIELISRGFTEHFIEPLDNEIKSILEYIKSNPFEKTHLNNFYKNQIILDEIRGEDIFKILPDYRKLTITDDGRNLI
jgi:MoaA/NifB/PqqE/SkfB family radical SAM enzyme